MAKRYDSDVSDLLEELKKVRPNRVVSGGKEFVRRCPYCGDSKNPEHHHLYIELHAPFFYYCQICNTKGALTAEVLKDFRCDTNIDILAFVERSSSEYRKLNKSRKNLKAGYLESLFTKTNNFPLYSPQRLILMKEKENQRLMYMFDRLKIDITPDYLNDVKVISSMRSFFIENDIDHFTEDAELIKKLASNYVGFLSRTGNNIYLRNVIKDSPDNRHWLYNVYSTRENTFTFYGIHSLIDILKPKLTIHVAEGIASILGVYEFLGRPKRSNEVFVSPVGKGFNRIINYFTALGFLDFDINYYSDSEIPINFYRRLHESNRILRNNMGETYVYYNTKAEDFGFEKSNISLKRTRLIL